MKEFAKINDVTNRYEITARTSHYYEKIGLINSVRDENSGYRLYDEAAIIRLKQILILRKMNISIKDIAEVFAANNSDTVLSVFDKKIHDIDNDIAQLYELKEIVLEFVRHLRQADFQNEVDITMLFNKAIEIEASIANETLSVEQLFVTSEIVDKKLLSVAVAPPENVVPPKKPVWKNLKSLSMSRTGLSEKPYISVTIGVTTAHKPMRCPKVRGRLKNGYLIRLTR